jgi:hypothetical protein
MDRKGGMVKNDKSSPINLAVSSGDGNKEHYSD